jgi:AAA15 family ATPase/GTPase
MLIEFRVANYRSIRENQTFSMVAAKDASHQDSNCMSSGISAIPQLIRTAVLYGANASGKSNLITALGFMRNLIETSAIGIREGQTFNVAPFRFDPETAQQPSEFEVTFVQDGVRYQYGFTLNASRVIKEWLLVYVERKAQRWFEREYDAKTGKDKWYFGSHLTGGKQRNLWSESTRANALFISTAVNLNSEQLRPIFNWFVNKLIIVGGNFQLLPFYTMECIEKGLNKSQIVQFLQVQIKTKKGERREFRFEAGKPAPAIEAMQEIDILMATLFHQGKNQDPIGFNLTEESHGTQQLFAYAGPMLEVLRDGKTLVVDELDSGLHSKMVRFLINLIQRDDSNNAQLIFTTHNTSLLDMDLFRRDQIWFMEKDQEQASHLYPLTDFSPRKGEALEKGYLMGRYGALPFFGDFNL